MELTEIIERILQTRQDLTQEMILRMVDEKKIEAEGYFTDEGAARVVASELGVEILRKSFQPEILSRDLVSGLNDVTIAGRVIIVYPTKTFSRPQKTEGKVAHLLVADESGKLNIVLWDDKTSLVENGMIKQGQIIRILHGYVREGYNGKLEVHVGLRSNIQISPPEVDDREYPSIEHFVQRVKDVTKQSKETSVGGIVDRMHPVSTFERRDGTLGKVRRLLLRDETGQIPLVLWNKKVDELIDLKSGSYIRVMAARVKENLTGQLEIHTKNSTQIELLTKQPKYSTFSLSRFTEINELKVSMYNLDVLARVIQIGRIREFKRRNGEKGYISTLLLNDETGFIHLNLWEDKASLSNQIQSGDIVLVEGAYTRERFGEINLNVGKQGVLTLNPNVVESENIPPYIEKTITVAEVRNENGPITIKGILATKPSIQEVATTQGKRVEVASFYLRDSAEEIRVSLWRDLIDAVKDLSVGREIKIRHAYIKRGLENKLELTSRILTSIEISKLELNDINTL